MTEPPITECDDNCMGKRIRCKTKNDQSRSKLICGYQETEEFSNRKTISKTSTQSTVKTSKRKYDRDCSCKKKKRNTNKNKYPTKLIYRCKEKDDNESQSSGSRCGSKNGIIKNTCPNIECEDFSKDHSKQSASETLEFDKCKDDSKDSKYCEDQNDLRKTSCSRVTFKSSTKNFITETCNVTNPITLCQNEEDKTDTLCRRTESAQSNKDLVESFADNTGTADEKQESHNEIDVECKGDDNYEVDETTRKNAEKGDRICNRLNCCTCLDADEDKAPYKSKLGSSKRKSEQYSDDCDEECSGKGKRKIETNQYNCDENHSKTSMNKRNNNGKGKKWSVCFRGIFSKRPKPCPPTPCPTDCIKSSNTSCQSKDASRSNVSIKSNTKPSLKFSSCYQDNIEDVESNCSCPNFTLDKKDDCSCSSDNSDPTTIVEKSLAPTGSLDKIPSTCISYNNMPSPSCPEDGIEGYGDLQECDCAGPQSGNDEEKPTCPTVCTNETSSRSSSPSPSNSYSPPLDCQITECTTLSTNNLEEPTSVCDFVAKKLMESPQRSYSICQSNSLSMTPTMSVNCPIENASTIVVSPPPMPEPIPLLDVTCVCPDIKSSTAPNSADNFKLQCPQRITPQEYFSAVPKLVCPIASNCDKQSTRVDSICSYDDTQPMSTQCEPAVCQCIPQPTHPQKEPNAFQTCPISGETLSCTCYPGAEKKKCPEPRNIVSFTCSSELERPKCSQPLTCSKKSPVKLSCACSLESKDDKCPMPMKCPNLPLKLSFSCSTDNDMSKSPPQPICPQPPQCPPSPKDSQLITRNQSSHSTDDSSACLTETNECDRLQPPKGPKPIFSIEKTTCNCLSNIKYPEQPKYPDLAKCPEQPNFPKLPKCPEPLKCPERPKCPEQLKFTEQPKCPEPPKGSEPPKCPKKPSCRELTIFPETPTCPELTKYLESRKSIEAQTYTKCTPIISCEESPSPHHIAIADEVKCTFLLKCPKPTSSDLPEIVGPTCPRKCSAIRSKEFSQPVCPPKNANLICSTDYIQKNETLSPSCSSGSNISADIPLIVCSVPCKPLKKTKVSGPVLNDSVKCSNSVSSHSQICSNYSAPHHIAMMKSESSIKLSTNKVECNDSSIEFPQVVSPSESLIKSTLPKKCSKSLSQKEYPSKTSKSSYLADSSTKPCSTDWVPKYSSFMCSTDCPPERLSSKECPRTLKCPKNSPPKKSSCVSNCSHSTPTSPTLNCQIKQSKQICPVDCPSEFSVQKCLMDISSYFANLESSPQIIPMPKCSIECPSPPLPLPPKGSRECPPKSKCPKASSRACTQKSRPASPCPTKPTCPTTQACQVKPTSSPKPTCPSTPRCPSPCPPKLSVEICPREYPLESLSSQPKCEENSTNEEYFCDTEKSKPRFPKYKCNECNKPIEKCQCTLSISDSAVSQQQQQQQPQTEYFTYGKGHSKQKTCPSGGKCSNCNKPIEQCKCKSNDVDESDDCSCQPKPKCPIDKYRCTTCKKSVKECKCRPSAFNLDNCETEEQPCEKEESKVRSIFSRYKCNACKKSIQYCKCKINGSDDEDDYDCAPSECPLEKTQSKSKCPFEKPKCNVCCKPLKECKCKPTNGEMEDPNRKKTPKPKPVTYACPDCRKPVQDCKCRVKETTKIANKCCHCKKPTTECKCKSDIDNLCGALGCLSPNCSTKLNQPSKCPSCSKPQRGCKCKPNLSGDERKNSCPKPKPCPSKRCRACNKPIQNCKSKMETDCESTDLSAGNESVQQLAFPKLICLSCKKPMERCTCMQSNCSSGSDESEECPPLPCPPPAGPPLSSFCPRKSTESSFKARTTSDLISKCCCKDKKLSSSKLSNLKPRESFSSNCIKSQKPNCSKPRVCPTVQSAIQPKRCPFDIEKEKNKLKCISCFEPPCQPKRKCEEPKPACPKKNISSHKPCMILKPKVPTKKNVSGRNCKPKDYPHFPHPSLLTETCSDTCDPKVDDSAYPNIGVTNQTPSTNICMSKQCGGPECPSSRNELTECSAKFPRCTAKRSRIKKYSSKVCCTTPKRCQASKKPLKGRQASCMPSREKFGGRQVTICAKCSQRFNRSAYQMKGCACQKPIPEDTGYNGAQEHHQSSIKKCSSYFQNIKDYKFNAN